MNARKKINIFSIIIFLCLSSEVVFSEQKNSSIISPADIDHKLKTESIANAKKIRDIMAGISKSRTVPRVILHELGNALEKNQVFFKKYQADENIRKHLYGEKNDAVSDYSLFWETRNVLLLNAQKKLDTYCFAAAVQMAATLNFDVYSAEWSGYMDKLVIDFALAAPLTMVKYLEKCTQDEFDSVFIELNYIYELPEKRKELEAELIKISIKEKKYTQTIEKIISRMYKDCFKYNKDYDWLCKDWPELKY